MHFQQARAIVPRQRVVLNNLTGVELYLRRYTEARTTADQALALQPTDLQMILYKVKCALGEGDLPGARAVLATVPKEVNGSSLVAWIATYGGFTWLFDDERQRMLLRLTPKDFNDVVGDWGISLAGSYWLTGDRAKARIYADSARVAVEDVLRSDPQDWVSRLQYGLSLAYLGRKTEAMQEGERAARLMPIAKNTEDGPDVLYGLSSIYIAVGEYDKAIDTLQSLLAVPFWMSRAYLKIDPNFAPLRANRRFQRLVAGS